MSYGTHACHSEKVAALSYSHTGVKICRGCGFKSHSCLQVCHRGYLAYLEVEASPSSGGTRAGVIKCFLIYSIAFMFHCIFQLFCHSFVVPSHSFCGFLSFSLLYELVSSMLSKLVTFMESDGESFYFFAILPLSLLFPLTPLTYLPIYWTKPTGRWLRKDFGKCSL